MSLIGATSMGNDPHILLDRLSDYVRPYPAKTLAAGLHAEDRRTLPGWNKLAQRTPLAADRPSLWPGRAGRRVRPRH